MHACMMRHHLGLPPATVKRPPTSVIGGGGSDTATKTTTEPRRPKLFRTSIAEKLKPGFWHPPTLADTRHSHLLNFGRQRCARPRGGAKCRKSTPLFRPRRAVARRSAEPTCRRGMGQVGNLLGVSTPGAQYRSLEAQEVPGTDSGEPEPEPEPPPGAPPSAATGSCGAISESGVPRGSGNWFWEPNTDAPREVQFWVPGNRF